MEIQKCILNGLDEQILFFYPIFEEGNAGEEARASRNDRPAFPHRQQRHQQSGDQGKSKEACVQPQSTRVREQWQSSHKPRDENDDASYNVESAIQGHRREADGSWYLRN